MKQQRKPETSSRRSSKVVIRLDIMQVINLRRDFEVLKMEDDETIRQYTDMLMTVENQIRFLGEKLTDKGIFEKVFVSLPEKFV